jgi:hypothetical protein
MVCVGDGHYGLGLHTAVWVEYVASGTATFVGSVVAAGISGKKWG